MVLSVVLGSILLGMYTISASSSCYQTNDGKCAEPLSQGHCGEDEWLVKGSSGFLDCEERECGPEEVMIENACFDIDDTSRCQGYGESLFLNAKGEPSCQCKDGWGRNKRKTGRSHVFGARKEKAATVESGGECFQEFTKGFCSDNFLVKFLQTNVFGCINNPCGDSTVMIPHFTTWNSFDEFTCHTVKSFRTTHCDKCDAKLLPENITNCEVVVDRADNTVTCESVIRLNTIVNTCLGKKCCRKGRVWSKYRNRCIRNFRRY